jgi:hypothetical protein
MERLKGGHHGDRDSRERGEAEGREYHGGSASVFRSQLIYGRTPLHHSIT